MKNLFIICLLVFVFSTVADQSENENTEEFIPTNEWQTVKEGIFHNSINKIQFISII